MADGASLATCGRLLTHDIKPNSALIAFTPFAAARQCLLPGGHFVWVGKQFDLLNYRRSFRPRRRQFLACFTASSFFSQAGMDMVVLSNTAADANHVAVAAA
jgi:hypothetical protein